MRPPEKIRRELVRKWVEKAEEDFRLAEHLLAEKTFWLNAVAFHAQQAVEKLLKAYLIDRQIEFRKTHDLGELLDKIAIIDAALAESFRDVIALNPYGVTARYPGDAPDVTQTEAEKAVELAEMVRNHLLSLLNPP